MLSFPEMITSFHIIKKVLSFFSFHLKMSSKDVHSQWRLAILMDTLPSLRQLRLALK